MSILNNLKSAKKHTYRQKDKTMPQFKFLIKC